MAVLRRSAIRIGTAGWGIAVRVQKDMPPGSSQLERYAGKFSITEINSSAYRHHRVGTYARWSGSVPDSFEFAVKVPNTLTHEGPLGVQKPEAMNRFFGEVSGLGQKLGVLLVQLPPSLTFSAVEAQPFFERLKERIAADVRIVCEPRHAAWGTPAADAFLSSLGVCRAAVDPSRWRQDAAPGGDRRLAYFRLHGSPQVYYSEYAGAQIDMLASRLLAATGDSEEVWCIFDNTAHGYALSDALQMQRVFAE